MKSRRVVSAALVTMIAGAGAGGAIAIASASAKEAHSAATYTLSTKKTSLGTILVNSKGDTVYMFVKDKKGAKKTSCDTACLAVWPLLTTTGTPTAGPGVKKSLITTFKVGSKTEVAYGGYPLYTYVGDSSPGSTKGQALNNSGGLWYVMSPRGSYIK